MIDVEYANAYTEVLEILKYIPKEDYEKIPISIIEVFETNSNKEYFFKYDLTKTLDEQNVSKRAKAIIGLLFRDYWATEEQRKKILIKQNYDRRIVEECKKELYNVNNIFCKKNKEVKDDIEDTKQLVVYKENVFIKYINKIKLLFNKRR